MEEKKLLSFEDAYIRAADDSHNYLETFQNYNWNQDGIDPDDPFIRAILAFDHFMSKEDISFGAGVDQRIKVLLRAHMEWKMKKVDKEIF